MLEYEIARRGGEEVVVALRGVLAEEDWTDRLKDFLEDHYIDDGIRLMRIDLSRLQRIDAGGMATLAVLWAEALHRGKSLVVEGATGPVRIEMDRAGALRPLEHPD
jgi:ABC-type transporter Mla MlaB component